MKTRIISTLALMAGVLLSGCTREDMPEGGAPGDGNRVVSRWPASRRSNRTAEPAPQATAERRNPTLRPLPMPRRK